MIRCINADKIQGIEVLQESLAAFRWKLIRVFLKLIYIFYRTKNLVFNWGKGKTVPPVKNKLLLMSATKIAAEIRNSYIKSEDVVQAYIDRIVEVEPFINAVAENCFREAITEAKKVDDLIKSKKYSTQQLEEEKPLLGVPFTVKVLLNVQGLRNTAGSLLFKDSPVATEDAPAVDDLKRAGAIVLATTNSTEFGLGYDTLNLLHGKTCNPYDTHRTAGGSSGGEGALVSSAASVIGLGNDFYGSIRFPASVTGIFAHKPSNGLVVSNVGCRPLPTELLSNFLTTGPMCRYAEDLVTMMQVLTSKNPEKLEFGREVDFKKIKIFYQLDVADPLMEPLDNEIRDAIKKVIHHFSTIYGVEVQEVNIKLLSFISIYILPILRSGLPNPIDHCSGGKLKHFSGMIELLKYAFGIGKLSLWCIFYLTISTYPNLCEIHKANEGKAMLKHLDEIFNDLLDDNSIFIYPASPRTAPRHLEMISTVYNSSYMGVFNFLGYPATQCPLGLNSNGLPQGVQIVAKKNNDPLTIACAQEISQVFGGWTPPS